MQFQLMFLYLCYYFRLDYCILRLLGICSCSVKLLSLLPYEGLAAGFIIDNTKLKRSQSEQISDITAHSS